MITKEQVKMVIKAIVNKGIMFVEEVPIIQDKITERWMLSELPSCTVENLICEDLDIEE